MIFKIIGMETKRIIKQSIVMKEVGRSFLKVTVSDESTN